MTALVLNPGLVRQIRLAGILYLIIIVAGLGAELGLRGPLIDLADAETTATAKQHFGDLGNADMRQRAASWLALRANDFVNVLRPAIRSAVGDIEDT
jgi:hypothetical protein